MEDRVGVLDAARGSGLMSPAASSYPVIYAVSQNPLTVAAFLYIQ
jgi:hypothetical protein